MAVPITQQPVADALTIALRTVRTLRSYVHRLRTASAAGPVERHQLIDALKTLRSGIAQLTQVSVVPGIAAYARAQFDNPALDIVAECRALSTAATAMADWIVANFPKHSGSGAWLVFAYDSNGIAVPLTFTSEDLASFRAHADAFLAMVA